MATSEELAAMSTMHRNRHRTTIGSPPLSSRIRIARALADSLNLGLLPSVDTSIVPPPSRPPIIDRRMRLRGQARAVRKSVVICGSRTEHAVVSLVRGCRQHHVTRPSLLPGWCNACSWFHATGSPGRGNQRFMPGPYIHPQMAILISAHERKHRRVRSSRDAHCSVRCWRYVRVSWQ